MRPTLLALTLVALAPVRAIPPATGAVAAPLLYRTSDKGARQAGVCQMSAYTGAVLPPAEQKRLRDCSTEIYPEFDLHIFEFRDNRNATDPAAHLARLEAIKATIAKDEGTIVFVFAHGWQHNAHACDGNLCCVRKLLNTLAFLEREHWNPTTPRRRVVGVYLSWRGSESVRWEGYRRVDVFTREIQPGAVAQRRPQRTRVAEALRLRRPGRAGQRRHGRARLCWLGQPLAAALL